MRSLREAVVEQMKFIADARCDGMLLSWPDWSAGLTYFAKEILPRMEQAGLRDSFNGHAAPAEG